MGKTIKQWEKVIEDLNEQELTSLYNSCKTFENIPEIKEEFDWTGIGVLGVIAKHELIKRKKGETK